MKKQVLRFYADVLTATVILFAIVVIGVIASGCATNKKQDRVDLGLKIGSIKVAGEKFDPVIEHSEIKDTDDIGDGSKEHPYFDGTGVLVLSDGITVPECKHIWVQEMLADTVVTQVDFTPRMVPAIEIIKTGTDYSFAPLVCLRCYKKINKVYRTDYARTDALNMRLDDSILSRWNSCEEDCKEKSLFVDSLIIGERGGCFDSVGTVIIGQP